MPDGTYIIPVVTKYPLETIFTPPAWCTSSFYTSHPFSATRATVSYYARAENVGGGFDQALKECYPPHFSTFNNIFSSENGVAIYSPGVCPSAWTPVTSLQPPYPTSQYICCPLGFDYHTKARCTKQGSVPTTVALNASKNITITPPYALLDWPIRIGWSSDQLNLFTPASAPLPAVLASATAASNSQTSGLSTGAKAGIGVGVAAAVVLLIGLIVGMLFLRKRRQEREREEAEDKTEELTFEPKSATSPPPGYDSRLASRGASTDAAAAGYNNREWYSAAEKRAAQPISPLAGPSSPGSSRTTTELDGTPRATQSPGTFTELPDIPRTGELDSTQVFEAYGREISREDLGMSTPGASNSPASAHVLRDPRSASPTNDPFRQGASMAGRWADYHPEQVR